VWNCSVRGGGSSTCYIFPNPEPSSSTSKIPSAPPMASLVPRGASREPGLILCSAAGEIRFWSNIATGLTGGEHFQAANISLSTSEVIVQLCRCEVRNMAIKLSFTHLMPIQALNIHCRNIVRSFIPSECIFLCGTPSRRGRAICESSKYAIPCCFHNF
jgi:hypothetical protein